MSAPRFRVPPYMSVMAMGEDVLVGLLPPRAVRIEDAPGYLPGLLEYLSDPRTAEEVAAYGRDRTDLSAAEADTLRHATGVLDALPEGHCSVFLQGVAHDALHGVPPSARTLPAVAEYRDRLASQAA